MFTNAPSACSPRDRVLVGALLVVGFTSGSAPTPSSALQELFGGVRSRAPAAWAEAQRAYSADAYRAFLEEHPEDPKAMEARVHESLIRSVARLRRGGLYDLGHFSVIPATVDSIDADSVLVTARGPYDFGTLRATEGSVATMKMQGDQVPGLPEPLRPGDSALILACAKTSGGATHHWFPTTISMVPGSSAATRLHEAARAADVEGMEACLREGACVDERDLLGRTPLVEAAAGGSAEAVRWLLDRGADVDGTSLEGETALLETCADSEDVEVVRLLLERGADAAAVSLAKETAVHHAAVAGNVDMLRLLAEVGAPLEGPRYDGAHPLHLAAWVGQVEVVRALLALGVEPDPGEGGILSPLAIARRKQFEEIVRLLEEARVEERSSGGPHR